MDLSMLEWQEGDAPAFADSAHAFAQRWLAAPEPEEEVLAEARRQGYTGAAIPESRGGLGLGNRDLIVLLRAWAADSVPFAARMATHFAACRALTDGQRQPGRAESFSPQLCNAIELDGALPLGLLLPSEATPSDGSRMLAPIDPGRCSMLVAMLPCGEGVDLRVVEPADVGGAAARMHAAAALDGLGPHRRPWHFHTEEHARARLRVAARRPFALYRLLLAAVHLGNAQRAAALAFRYAQERRQTGRPIIGHHAVRAMLVRMQIRLSALQCFVERAAGEPSLGNGSLDLGQQACAFAGEVGEAVCLDAVQVHGGYGYMQDYGVERRLRHAKALQALAGDAVGAALGGPAVSLG